MATRLCDVCGVRPAVVTARRVVPGGGSRTEHLCEIHAAEARGGGRRRSPFGGGGSLFDDFFDRFFEDASAGPRSIPIGGGGEATSGRRGAEQVDNAILQRFHEPALAEGRPAGRGVGEP